MPGKTNSLRDKLEDNQLDLSLSQLTEVPVQEIVSPYFFSFWYYGNKPFFIFFFMSERVTQRYPFGFVQQSFDMATGELSDLVPLDSIGPKQESIE